MHPFALISSGGRTFVFIFGVALIKRGYGYGIKVWAGERVRYPTLGWPLAAAMRQRCKGLHSFS
jgi:hypothetical protein